ncbi:MAG: recombinase family protein [Ruminococcus sp.]|nr:recombinase family protein [Ruminococcus sp.]
MKTGAVYIRVSTDEQTEFSPESQLKAIKKYAEEHEIILPDEFIFNDDGISGRKASCRPEFLKMISTAKLKPKPFDVILVWKFSRFARNREDSVVYKSMLRRDCRIDVISVSEQLSEDKSSVLMEAIIEAMDEYYSLNLAEEVKRGMNEKFSRGEIVSQAPFGYKAVNGKFVVDAENAEIVKMIYNYCLSGMGIRAIAKKVNDMGARTRRGNFFENRTIEYILTNPVYIGKLRRSINGRDITDRFHQSKDNTMTVNGTHIPIIDTDTFEQVQARIAENKKLYPRYSRQALIEYMLKGIVRCSACGATLTAQNYHGGMQCHQYAKGSCNISHFIMKDRLAQIIIEKIRSDFENYFFDVEINIESDADCENAVIMSSIVREEKKLKRIHEAYESGIDTLEEYRIRKHQIQKNIDNLKKQIKKTGIVMPKIKCKETVSESIKILENNESSETLKNEIIRSLTEKIIFVKPSGVIEIYYKI